MPKVPQNVVFLVPPQLFLRLIDTLSKQPYEIVHTLLDELSECKNVTLQPPPVVEPAPAKPAKPVKESVKE